MYKITIQPLDIVGQEPIIIFAKGRFSLILAMLRVVSSVVDTYGKTKRKYCKESDTVLISTLDSKIDIMVISIEKDDYIDQDLATA
jgi:hypothetical protein